MITAADAAREALRLDALATPGPWYSCNPDDDHAMNAYAVTTDIVPYADGLDVGRNEKVNDHSKIIALTLLQSPRVVCHKQQRWSEDADFIAFARTALPDLARALLDMHERHEKLVDDLRKLADTMAANHVTSGSIGPLMDAGFAMGSRNAASMLRALLPALKEPT